jgi:UDP-glucose:glycoprotein glucosyltransferase
MAPLKVWQLQDLSLQAAARIMNSPAENRLSVFADLAQNFPSYARTLSKASVPKDLKIEVKKNREAFVHGLSVQVGFNSIIRTYDYVPTKVVLILNT